jgi:hypothetical protein
VCWSLAFQAPGLSEVCRCACLFSSYSTCFCEVQNGVGLGCDGGGDGTRVTCTNAHIYSMFLQTISFKDSCNLHEFILAT